MKLTIEPTDKFVKLGAVGVGVDCRIWEGVDEHGTPVHCYVPRVAVPDGAGAEAQARFVARLKETRAPSPDVAALPLRLIL